MPPYCVPVGLLPVLDVLALTAQGDAEGPIGIRSELAAPAPASTTTAAAAAESGPARGPRGDRQLDVELLPGAADLELQLVADGLLLQRSTKSA